MEVIIYKELAGVLEIQLDDLFINEKGGLDYCKLMFLNETHSAFKIPYEKCATKVKVCVFKCCLIVKKNTLNTRILMLVY